MIELSNVAVRLDTRTRSPHTATLAALAVGLALTVSITAHSGAQETRPAGPPAIRIADSPGPASGITYVLLSGLMGGTAGFSRLESRLGAHGHRVITIDPYHLAIDSTAVGFADLAGHVRTVLASQGVDSAVVVGHAHGAGVALRLAALDPRRVTALYFLDVGALPAARTKVFSSAMRLAPIINRLPGGRRFLRGRIINGLRENAGRDDWLDARTQHSYAEPILDNIGKVVALAGRLAIAREPEPVQAVVARVEAPVTLILGAAPHPSGPDDEELAALRPLRSGLRVACLAGVGHFPHEEAPDVVAAILLGRRSASCSTAGAPRTAGSPRC